MQETVIVNKAIEPTPAGIQKWCQDYVADLLGTQPGKIDPNTEFDRFGLFNIARFGTRVEMYLGDLTVSGASPAEAVIPLRRAAWQARHAS